MCLEIAGLSVQFSIQRLTTFQGLYLRPQSAEFLHTLHPRHNSLLGFLCTTTQLLLQGIWGWIFVENGLCPGKKHQHHAALGPRLHGLFLYSLLHHPRQGYRVTIMNPFRGKARLSRAPSQALIPALTSLSLLYFSYSPFPASFYLVKTSNKLCSSGNAASQLTSTSSHLPDNDALFQGPLWTDEGMKGCFKECKGQPG